MVSVHSKSESEGRKRRMSQLKDSQAERANLPFLHLFTLSRASTDGRRLTPIEKGNLLYSVTDSNVNLIQKYSHRHTQNNVLPNIWPPCGLFKLTHTITMTHCPLLSILTSFSLEYSCSKPLKRKSLTVSTSRGCDLNHLQCVRNLNINLH